MRRIDLCDRYGIPYQGTGLIYSGMSLMQEIVSMGYSAYIVGGCVRDLLMGKKPHDIDIATNMPIDVIKQHYKTIEYGGGERHGTVIVHHEGEDFELTQFRSESTYSDNRRPDEVKFVNTFKEDSLRRDFTINAMGIGCDGEIVDYHGGYDDIKNAVIRTVGNSEDRFTEDSLRILRAARFAANLGFDIDEDARAAMTKLADTVNNVSGERIRDEFFKAMSNPYSFGIFIRYLNELKVLHAVFNQAKSVTIPYICRAHTTDKIVNLALLFCNAGSDDDLKRLKITNDEYKAIKFCHNSFHLFNQIDIENYDTHELKVKMVTDVNFHYLIIYYESIMKKEVNRVAILHYQNMKCVYDLDKTVNAYISSLGIEGNRFGQTVNAYRKWVFNYYHNHLLLPLTIEWKNMINGFINEPSTQLLWID